MKHNVFLRNFKLRTKLFVMSIVPLLALTVICVSIFSNTYMSNAVKQVEEDLFAVAASTESFFDQNAGKYYISSNDNFWKGSYNITKSDGLINAVKERTSMDITVIFEKGIAITTAKDEEGNAYEYRYDDILKKTVYEGKEMFGDCLSVNNKQQYVYAVPLFQVVTEGQEAEVVGAVLVSDDKELRLGAIKKTISMIVLISMALLVVAATFTLLIANGITKSFKVGISFLEKLAKGKLNIGTKELDIMRKDEIGDMYRSIHGLQTDLRKLIVTSKTMSRNIEEDVVELDKRAHMANKSVEKIDDAIVSMNYATEKQSSISARISKSIDVLGDMIENTYTGIRELNSSNIELKKSGDFAIKVVGELSDIKLVLNKIIKAINIQTKDTYELTKDIKKYAQSITEVAEETNLLALNASIEAARVGAAGKGFAIVAMQIQALAEQSNMVSNDITQTVKLLVADTKDSVNTMAEVTSIVDKLNENIEETRNIFKVVNENVDGSVNGLKRIEKQAEVMDNTRMSITKVVDELEDVIQNNVRLVTNTKDVSRNIEELFMQSNSIKKSTESLIESMDVLEV